ncbi:hypothetical protein D8674_024458 [Pyrus ussuriensis x Pyrus communis]|uniref:RING-type domain-containing protein n=1 Tax=Pyrus ussuriensis x Pyrus communis TaxID=2448454 RepID=A0A5N5H2Z2_9ROSA|nr:hypothetical protein D8674_024458 [Pyrus ussuriensis x Pyrus communis]
MTEIEEKTCSICAEEMDLTDQQLKPWKCGYEVCVWCWHHIMAMAEKDGNEGCCPVCRTPYDKKLLEWQHMVSFQKKPKGFEVKKQHLTDVGVLQRSLVQSNGFKDRCIDRMEQSAGRNFMHSFASKRPRVPTFLVCLVTVNAVKQSPYSEGTCYLSKDMDMLALI